MAGIVRHIEDQSSADIAYDTAVEMAARASFGYIRVVTDYADDDGFSQDIFIRAVPNPFSCYLDPASVEPDGSDARYGFAFEDIERKQFEADYPKADACDFERSGPDFSDWVKKDTVRIAEYFEVVETGVKVWQAQDGSASEEEIEGAISRTMKKRKVIWRKMTAREVLEETGIVVEIGAPIDHAEILPSPESATVGRHYVLMVFDGRPVGGTLAAGDDAGDARWFGAEALATLPMTKDTGRILARLGMR